MNEKDLPVGVELVETNDMHGLPCIELVISCATKEIALEYYKKSEQSLKLQELMEDMIKTNKEVTDKATDIDWCHDDSLGKRDRDSALLQSLIVESEK